MLHCRNKGVNRNKVTHLHEVVHQLAHWWDDVVFEQYPTLDACIRAAKISSSELTRVFGPHDGMPNSPAAGHYAQGVKYGIGREVLAKMLEGTETR